MKHRITRIGFIAFTLALLGILVSQPVAVLGDTSTFRPSAAGSVTSVPQSTGANHWQEAGDNNDSTYNYTSPGNSGYDYYNIPDHSTQSGTITNVALNIRGWVDDSSDVNAYFFAILYTHSTEYDSDHYNDNGSINGTHTTNYANNPNTSAAWTWSEIDALQIGGAVNGDTSGAYFADVWIVVTYTPGVSPPTNVAATDGTYTDKVVVTWTKATGATGYKVFRDGSLVATLGDVATYDDTGAAAPTITAGTTVATDGTATDKVSLSLSGTSVANGTTHTYKVHSTQGANESGDSNTDTGYRGHGSLTYQWQWSATSGGTYTNFSGATSATYDDTSIAPGATITAGTASASTNDTTQVVLNITGASIANGTTYYYHCVLNATGASQQISSNDGGYRGASTLTYQWYRSAANSDANYSILSGATTVPYNDTTAPAPSITAGTITASDGTYTDKVVLTSSGASANAGDGRYYYCVLSATNASNTPQNTNHTQGNRSVGTLNFQWQVSAADSDASYSDIGGATSNPYNYTGAPAPTITAGTITASDGTSTAQVVLTSTGASANAGAGRYYKLVLSATGVSNTSPATDRGYIGVGSLNFQWQVSAADSDASYSDIGGATTNPYNYTSAPAPTITAGSAVATDGTSTSQVSLSLSGTSTSNGAGRYYKLVLSATGATNASPATDRGYRGVGSLTYQWQRSSGDADSGYSDINGATGSTYNDTNAPAPTVTPGTASASSNSVSEITLSISGASANNGAGRYYRCVLNASGATQQNSASDRGYRGVGTLTYQWWRSAFSSDDSYNLLSGATTNPYSDTTAPAPSITPGTASASDGTSTAHITLSLSGVSGNNGATKYYYCVVSATGASDQNTNHASGYRAIGSLSYQWWRSAADSDASYSSLTGATTNPYDDTTAPSPSIDPGIATASDGTSGSYVTLTLTDYAITDGEGRYYYCVVSATGVTSQNSTHDRGYRDGGVLTFQWQRSSGDADSGYSDLSGATTAVYNDTTAPAGSLSITTGAVLGFGRDWAIVEGEIGAGGTGVGRYYKCVVSATGVTPETSNSDRGYRGAGGVTSVGFQYGLTTSYGSSVTINGTYQSGDKFVSTIRGLTAGTVYHWQAGIFSGSWSYGNDSYFNTLGSPVIYEYNNTGGNGDSAAIYGDNWGAQSITIGNTSHTIITLNLMLKRVGSPGTVIVSIRHADINGDPTGLDIASATLNGDLFSTSYLKLPFTLDEGSYTAGAGYTIVVSAPTGDGSNYVLWQWNTSGGYADGAASHSTDSGNTWTNDTGKDMMFEVWGNSCIRVVSAVAVNNYIEDGDILFSLEYINIYPPYYQVKDATQYFSIRLYDTDGITLLAQTPMLRWGDMPGSIYLNANQASKLTPGASYYIAIYGEFSGNPVATIQLQTADWSGDIKGWVIATAKDMEIYYSALPDIFTVDSPTYGIILGSSRNDDGSDGCSIFSQCIQGLMQVHPELFQSIVTQPGFTPPATVHAPIGSGSSWQDAMGVNIAQFLSDCGALFGISGKYIGSGLLLIIYLAWAVSTSRKGGTPYVALAVGFPIIGFGVWALLVDYTIIFAIIVVLAVIALIGWWVTRT